MSLVEDVRKAVLDELLSEPYDWGEWKERFAWWPVKIDGHRVWWVRYYSRVGDHQYAKYNNQHITKVQRKTVFDMLK